MLEAFLISHRATLIDRCRAKVALRRVPQATELELQYGIPLFLDQLVDTLRLEQALGPVGGTAPVTPPAPETSSNAPNVGETATQHGAELLRRGFTLAQVVHDYGDLCQAITELAIEQNMTISVMDFHTLNRCLDNAIADAVTEFGRQHDVVTSDEATKATNERIGFFAHELRNLISTSILALAAVKKGNVGLGGATGALLERSLVGLRDLVDYTLIEVRLEAGVVRRERILVAEFIAEVQQAATLHAAARDLDFVVGPIERGLAVEGDRQILAAAVANVLQNAVKFTRPHGRVALSVHTVADRILINVQDECGGLPEGMEEEIFRPFEQAGPQPTGVGLGLPLSRRGVEADGGKMYAHNLPGTGCVFTIDLPRSEALPFPDMTEATTR